MTVDEVLAAVLNMRVGLVVVTGGEPMMQQTELTELVAALADGGVMVEIETNGTVVPSAQLAALSNLRFNVSPKLSNSGDEKSRRIKRGALEVLGGLRGTAFKFVVTRGTPDELAEIREIVSIARGGGGVWVMPEGISADAQVAALSWLMLLAVREGWNVSSRLHVLGYGNKRGI